MLVVALLKTSFTEGGIFKFVHFDVYQEVWPCGASPSDIVFFGDT